MIKQPNSETVVTNLLIPAFTPVNIPFVHDGASIAEERHAVSISDRRSSITFGDYTMTSRHAYIFRGQWITNPHILCLQQRSMTWVEYEDTGDHPNAWMTFEDNTTTNFDDAGTNSYVLASAHASRAIPAMMMLMYNQTVQPQYKNALFPIIPWHPNSEYPGYTTEPAIFSGTIIECNVTEGTLAWFELHEPNITSSTRLRFSFSAPIMASITEDGSAIPHPWQTASGSGTAIPEYYTLNNIFQATWQGNPFTLTPPKSCEIASDITSLPITLLRNSVGNVDYHSLNVKGSGGKAYEFYPSGSAGLLPLNYQKWSKVSFCQTRYSSDPTEKSSVSYARTESGAITTSSETLSDVQLPQNTQMNSVPAKFNLARGSRASIAFTMPYGGELPTIVVDSELSGFALVNEGAI